ncbi:fructose-bisphosphate aldolase [Planobispora rosea]|uniref:Fructose-bisphosphate aldolase n=1 Tax=Planobispora rosea TaxID=35762 RepID=A0A8J3S4E9_PLARO|nr:class II fructose-bisphosphate aldolase [Planobispora rosea]GGS81039.1 fructose-bisphosphate aldolase [Planobispora rosea]GIH85930.1 fructose-bisphosphate aldolase [Planobispora rosea]
MPVVGIGDIVRDAPGGVGAFNVIQLEHAEAIVAGAEAAGAPVVLQISENCVRYHGALAPVAAASLAVARASSVDVAVHLDHATDRELVEEAVELGIGSVMFDASALPDGENAALTAEVAAWCHRRGVWVEAELGEIGGKDGAHAPGTRTRPREAADYVARTGVDALAVAVGTSHAMTTRDAVLDLALISELRDAVPVPLVLHGSSGVPDATLSAAVRHGMKKINIATRLNEVFTQAIRDRLAADEKVVDPRTYMRQARTAVAAEVTHLLGVLRG